MDLEFVQPPDGFVKMEHVIGRLLVIIPCGMGERKSTLPGSSGTYQFIVTDTIVCDGDVTDMIPELPMHLEDFQLAGATVVGQLKGLAAKNRPLPFGDRKPMAARLGKHKTAYGSNQGWDLRAATDRDLALCRDSYARVKALLAAAEPDPFK